MGRARRGLISSLIALGIGVGLSLAALNLEVREVPTRLPDGSTVAFVGMAHGAGPGITYGRPWQRLLYPVTPPQLRDALMKDAVQLGPNPWPGALALWFRHSSHFPAPGRMGARRLLTVDAHGCPFEWGYWEGGMRHHEGTMMAGRVRVFPRREPALEHRYLVRTGASEWIQALCTPTENPGVGQFPRWQAAPLPQTRTAGEVSVTLQGLRAPVTLPSADQPLRDDRSIMSEVELRLNGSEAERKRWRPIEVTLADATGNRHQREDLQVPQLDDHQPKVEWTAGSKPGEWIVRLPGGLCAHEDAWKVRTEWSRHRSSSKLPDAVWQVPSLPVLLGQRYRTFTVGPGIEGTIEANIGVKGKAVVVVGLRFVPEGRRFRVEATDDRGRSLTSIETGFWDPSILQTRCREYIFYASPETRWLDLRVKVYDTRIVEFLAKPANGR